jgi:hypothetical protein
LLHLGLSSFKVQTYASFQEESRGSSQRIFETVLSSSTIYLLVIHPYKDFL